MPKKMKSFQLHEDKKIKKMKSFQLFKDKKAKDWKESLKDGGSFFEKNKQLILLFLLGLATFPILFFLTVSLSKATTSLVGTVSPVKENVRTVHSSDNGMKLFQQKR